MKTKKNLSVAFFLAFMTFYCFSQEQNTSTEGHKFRWRYKAESGQWYNWKDTIVKADVILLEKVPHAGDVTFQIFINKHGKTYSAYIRWTNRSNDSLNSAYDYVCYGQKSEVNLKVEHATVTMTETYYLEVEAVR